MQGPLGYPSVATFSKVIIQGATGGLFAYSTAPPATGSLVISIAAQQGTDPEGNFFFPGVTIYSGPLPNDPYINVNSGAIFFGGGQATGGKIAASGGGALGFSSPLALAGDQPAEMALLDSVATSGTPASGSPALELEATMFQFWNGVGGAGALYILVQQNGSNQLQCNQSIFSEGSLIALSSVISLAGGTSNQAFVVDNLTDPDPFFEINGNGDHSWGPGTSATDTVFKRTGTGQLAIINVTANGTYSLTLAPTTTGIGGFGVFMVNPPDFAIGAYESTDSVGSPRFVVLGNGTIEWGPGGSSPVDTTMSRIGAGFLQTNAIQADSGPVTGGYHEITTGFSNNWAGQIQYKFLAEPYLVFIRFRLSTPNGSVHTNGETIYSALPAGYYFATDNTLFHLSLGNTVLTCSITASGVITFNGAGFTSAGTEFLYGQAIYGTQT